MITANSLVENAKTLLVIDLASSKLSAIRALPLGPEKGLADGYEKKRHNGNFKNPSPHVHACTKSNKQILVLE